MEESYKKLEDARENSDKLIDEEKNLDTNYKKIELEEKEYDKISLKYNQKVENIDRFVTSNPFLNEYKEQIPQSINIEVNEKEKNVANINNDNYQNYQDPQNKEENEYDKKDEEQEKNQEETALIDPEKENRFKQFFKRIKEKLKAVVVKITGKEINDKQAEEMVNSEKIQDKLDEVSNSDIEIQETINNIDLEGKEFREDLSRSNSTPEEIVKATIERYEAEQHEINNKIIPENPAIE